MTSLQKRYLILVQHSFQMDSLHRERETKIQMYTFTSVDLQTMLFFFFKASIITYNFLVNTSGVTHSPYMFLIFNWHCFISISILFFIILIWIGFSISIAKNDVVVKERVK